MSLACACACAWALWSNLGASLAMIARTCDARYAQVDCLVMEAKVGLGAHDLCLAMQCTARGRVDLGNKAYESTSFEELSTSAEWQEKQLG